MPTTVADFDRELEKTKKKILQLKEGKKAAAAREREKERKWRSAAISAMGELLLESLGCNWKDVNFDELSAYLTEWIQGEHRENIHSRIITDDRTPAIAKSALDVFKKSHRDIKKIHFNPQLDPEEV